MFDDLPVRRIADLKFTEPPEIAEPDCRREKGLRRLNLNESLRPPSPKAIQAMADALGDVESYPDHGCAALAELLAGRTGIPVDRISFGNGSGELLTMAAALAIEPGDDAVFPTPTFPTCAKGVNIAGGNVIEVPVDAAGVNDVDAMLAAMTDRTRLFYLCTPNNPTGGVIAETALKKAAEGVPDDCLLVVDEAYYEFAHAEAACDVLALLKSRTGPWAVTRTFSKAYSMAGIRIGYVFTSNTELQKAFWKLRGNFNVNRIGLAGAVAAMKDEAYLGDTLAALIVERTRLEKGLEGLGFSVYPTQANFLTARAPKPATELSAALARHGLLVQPMPWPGGFGTLRITIGNADDIDNVLQHLRNELRAVST